MILSDRTIREQLASGRIVIDPLDDSFIQPSSVDLTLDRYFRVFRNHTMRVIDVKEDQEELTELVEIKEDDVFILHPGEFVLGSTAERVALPDDLVARLEGKSSLGRLGLLIHSSLPGSEPVLVEHEGELRQRPIEQVVRKQLQGRVVGFDPDTFEVSYHDITGWYEGPSDRIFEVVLRSGRSVRVTAGHNLFTLDRDGQVKKLRTLELEPGVMVAIPGAIPGPDPATATPPVLDLRRLLDESHDPWLVVEGPTVRSAVATREAAAALRASGYKHTDFYRSRGMLPMAVARQLPGLVEGLGSDDRVRSRGGRNALPVVINVDRELAWLLGLYVAEGYKRHGQVTVSNTDEAILDRAEAAFARLGLPVYRAAATALTCSSNVLAEVITALGVGDGAKAKRLPALALGWPSDVLEALLEGMLDGDGSRDDARDSYWTSSPGLVSDVLLLAERLGKRAAAWRRERGGQPLWQVGMPHREHKLDRPPSGELAWDEVVEVRDTREVETIFDLSVRPDGRHIENFLAGSGGVFVSNTAGFVDAGWDGHLTLELSNVANLPITLYPGMKIGQISFLQMTTAADNPYGSSSVGSKYKGQRGPTQSRYFENFRR